jgi:hypothetical protein
MVIWQGRGWIPFAIVIGLGAVVQWLVETHLQVPYQGWPLSGVLVITGLSAGLMGAAWNRRGQAQHTLFFVPLQWWLPIAVALPGS